jgi:hypothetical protein
MAAAGTVAVTNSKVAIAGEVQKQSIAWTSDGSGAVSGNPKPTFKGRLVQARFTPAAAGNAPTDNYSVVVNDAAGADVLKGLGATQSATVTKIVTPTVPVIIDSATLDVVVSAAGATKQGTVELYIL